MKKAKPQIDWRILQWRAHDLLGHSLHSLYAIRNAPLLGIAELGVHTGCKECDNTDNHIGASTSWVESLKHGRQYS